MTWLKLSDYGVVKGMKMNESYIVRPHIKLLCKALELTFCGALPDGKQNLLVNIPPRFSKTTTVRNFIEWATGHVTDCEWLYLSYGATLAANETAKIKRIMAQGWYQEMFPHCRIDTKGGMNRQDHFTTTGGACIYGTGADGAVTGFGGGKSRPHFGGAIIIDDPIKASDAHSETIRKKVITNYKETIKTRRNNDKTPIIMIMQRLHPEDLSGYILKEEADEYHHVIIPGLDEETGESLWEDRISAKRLLKMREVDPVTFYTQYQQKAITPGGNIIKDSWWNYYDDLEEVIKRCTFIAIFADTAYKKTEAADYTVFQVWGFEGGKRAYLLDQIREKMEFPELLQASKAIWNKWQNHPLGKNARQMFVEDKASGQSLVQSLGRQIKGHVEAWLPKEWDSPDDKVSRAKEMAWLVHGDCVWLPNPETITGAEWVDNEYLPEWREFKEDDSHTHDDQVDASTMAILTWRSMGGGFSANEDG